MKKQKKDPTLGAEKLAEQRVLFQDGKLDARPRERTEDDIFYVLAIALKYFPNESDVGLANMASTTVEVVRAWRKERK